MSLADDLYRDIILEHFKNPRNQGAVEHPTFTAQGTNPFCGDEMTLSAALKEGRIQQLRFDAQGCSISQASTSMMSEILEGKSVEEAEALIAKFKAAMLEDGPFDFPEEAEDLSALEGVKKYPVRIKCALLSWNTLLEGIQAHRKGKRKASHVEGEEGEKVELANVQNPPPEEVEASSKKEEARETLKQVMDPELNLSIVDLGLIYKIKVQGSHVAVDYTLTSPGCPLAPVIKEQMTSALQRLPWVKDVDTQLVWQPPWDPRTMASDEVKTELGIW